MDPRTIRKTGRVQLTSPAQLITHIKYSLHYEYIFIYIYIYIFIYIYIYIFIVLRQYEQQINDKSGFTIIKIESYVTNVLIKKIVITNKQT